MSPPLIQESSFTELPFGYQGRVFRSRMPFNGRDPHDSLFNRYLAESIEVIVVLADDDEIKACTGRDLRAEYQRYGMSVIYLPISDFSTPSQDALDRAIFCTMDEMRAGKNLVVHCQAGMGRTGLFLACLAQRALQLSAEAAIAWVRSYIPGAIETPVQLRFVLKYGDCLC
jgi:protein-tyrosine phosphatase